MIMIWYGIAMIDSAQLFVRNRIQQITKTYALWLPSGWRVLDAGCGNGIVAAGVEKRLSVKVSGCDIEDYLLRNIPYTHMIRKDHLPFRSSSFDAVMINDVLHHTSFENQEILLREAVRVARRAVLLFELLPTPMNYIGDFIVNKIYHSSVPTPLTIRPTAGWQAVFRTLPVSVQTVHVPRPFFSPFSHVAFRLAKDV